MKRKQNDDQTAELIDELDEAIEVALEQGRSELAAELADDQLAARERMDDATPTERRA